MTVWVGSLRYFFSPGRDVIVGHGGHCDIRLDRPGLGGVDDASQPIPDLVLRFAGTHWLAVDQTHHGLFVDGARMSTVDIRDGQTIAIGDPEKGPRLRFQVSAADEAPASATDPHGVAVPALSAEQPADDPATGLIPVQADIPATPVEPETARIPAVEPHVSAPPGGGTPPAMPDEPATTRLQVEPTTAGIPAAPLEFFAGGHSPMERPTRPFRHIPAPVTAAPPPPPPHHDEPAEGRRLIRMSETTQQPLPAQQEPGSTVRPGEPTPQTNRLPLLHAGARTIGVAAYQLGLTVDGHELLSDVSFTTPPGALIAVVGPSPTRTFALTSVLGGSRSSTSGVLTVDGHDVHAEPEAMRSRVGVVARDNRVHRNLTVERALEYAAELRLPPETSMENRTRILDQVLDELELTPHRTTKVANLPPAQQRCASLAVELLARPSMLVVDEPGAGLDPAQEKHLMGLLRRQADLGCVVVMAVPASNSLALINMCDQVLLLTPTGQLAFAGPPSHIESALGTTDWSQIFGQISTDPTGAHHAFLTRRQASGSPAPPSVTPPESNPAVPSFGRQFRLIIRRQARMVWANPIFALFLLLLPVALGMVTLLIPGSSGLGRAAPSSVNTHEAIEILAALNFAAVIMGTTATVRALVTERRIFRREQDLGLSASAYLLAKIVVFGGIAAVQAAILTTIVIVGKGGPVRGAVLLGSADLELYLSVAATTIVSAIVGLALSSFGKSMGEVLPLAVPAVLASLLFAGGLVSLVGTWGYDQVSWFVPAQWGFAAAASTVDLHRVDKLAAQNSVWAHYSGWWVFDMLMLGALGVLWAGLVRYRLRVPT